MAVPVGVAVAVSLSDEIWEWWALLLSAVHDLPVRHHLQHAVRVESGEEEDESGEQRTDKKMANIVQRQRVANVCARRQIEPLSSSREAAAGRASE